VPQLIFGVAFGNLFLGLPFALDEYLRPHYDGGLLDLLTPFPLLCGLLSLSMLVMHGSVWLGLKTESDLRQRANRVTVAAAITTSLLFAVGGLWIWSGMNGLHILNMADPNAVADPLVKSVIVTEGAWLTNFTQRPEWLALPLTGLVLPLVTAFLARLQREGLAFFTSALSVASIVATAGVALFPFVLPSSLNPNHSLTLWDAASSALTLNVMLLVACVFVPTVLGYTIWSYTKLWGRISVDHLEKNRHSLY